MCLIVSCTIAHPDYPGLNGSKTVVVVVVIVRGLKY